MAIVRNRELRPQICHPWCLNICTRFIQGMLSAIHTSGILELGEVVPSLLGRNGGKLTHLRESDDKGVRI